MQIQKENRIQSRDFIVPPSVTHVSVAMPLIVIVRKNATEYGKLFPFRQIAIVRFWSVKCFQFAEHNLHLHSCGFRPPGIPLILSYMVGNISNLTSVSLLRRWDFSINVPFLNFATLPICYELVITSARLHIFALHLMLRPVQNSMQFNKFYIRLGGKLDL